MSPATAPVQLSRLATTLNAQMPVLFSFTVLRWTIWSIGACALAPCVPERLKRGAALVRQYTLGTATLVLIALTAFDPPSIDICVEYPVQRVQGMSALMSIVVLACSNRTIASAMAVSALKGVGDMASAAVPLALVASYAACDLEGETITYVLFTIYTLLHAVECYDDARSERTHATTLATIYLCMDLCVRGWMAVCCCRVRERRRALSRPTARGRPAAADAPAAAAAKLPLSTRLRLRRRGAQAAGPPHTPAPR